MRFEFKCENAKMAIEANLDELAALGKGVLELADNNISLPDIVNMVTSGKVPDSFKPEKKEESEEPEEATDEEKLRDDYISKIRELGYKVMVEDPEKDTEERYIECYTFCDLTSNKEKAALVRAWLKKNGIKYAIDSSGIKKYAYKLTPQQLIELQDYLLENEVTSCEANI